MDFIVAEQELTLTPEEPISCINVQIIDDDIAENIEEFQLNLTAANDNTTNLLLPTTRVAIEDNDCESIEKGDT